MLGSIRVNAYYDFTGMNSTEGFMPYEIPVGEEKIEGLSSVYLGARQSRLGMEGTASTKVGLIRTYIEVDFASSSQSLWRLRHAFAEWNYFKMGYSWSLFLDNAATPTTIDFEGPNSSLSKRHGILKYERKVFNKGTAGISIKSPETDYYNPADTLISNKNKQGNFDIVGRYKYDIGIRSRAGCRDIQKNRIPPADGDGCNVRMGVPAQHQYQHYPQSYNLCPMLIWRRNCQLLCRLRRKAARCCL